MATMVCAFSRWLAAVMLPTAVVAASNIQSVAAQSQQRCLVTGEHDYNK